MGDLRKSHLLDASITGMVVRKHSSPEGAYYPLYQTEVCSGSVSSSLCLTVASCPSHRDFSRFFFFFSVSLLISRFKQVHVRARAEKQTLRPYTLHTHAHTLAHAHIHTLTNTPACSQAHTHTHTHTLIHSHTRARTHTRIPPPHTQKKPLLNPQTHT